MSDDGKNERCEKDYREHKEKYTACATEMEFTCIWLKGYLAAMQNQVEELKKERAA